MLVSPSLAIDLPLRALNANGAVSVTCKSAEYLRARHSIAIESPGLTALERLLAQIAEL